MTNTDKVITAPEGPQRGAWLWPEGCVCSCVDLAQNGDENIFFRFPITCYWEGNGYYWARYVCILLCDIKVYNFNWSLVIGNNGHVCIVIRCYRWL